MKFLFVLKKKAEAIYSLSSVYENSSTNLSNIFNQISIGNKNYESHSVFIEGSCQTSLDTVKTDLVITYYDVNNKVTKISTKEVKVKVRDNKFERTPVIIEGFVLDDGYVEIHASISNKSDKRSSSSNTLTYR